jgi:hypothetical protein
MTITNDYFDREDNHELEVRSNVKIYCSVHLQRSAHWYERARSAVTMIVSECLKRKDSCERASSIATMVTRTIKLVCDDDREQLHGLQGCLRTKEFDCDDGRTSFQVLLHRLQR